MIGWINTHEGWHSARRVATQEDDGYQWYGCKPVYLTYCNQIAVYAIEDAVHNEGTPLCPTCEAAKTLEGV